MKIKQYCSLVLILLVLTSANLLFAQEAGEIKLTKPMPKQLEFDDWEVGAFIHY